MIKNIAVIGTGVIGTGWIIRFLAHNKKVIAYDKNLKLKKNIIKEIKNSQAHIKKLFKLIFFLINNFLICGCEFLISLIIFFFNFKFLS